MTGSTGWDVTISRGELDWDRNDPGEGESNAVNGNVPVGCAKVKNKEFHLVGG